MYVLLLENLAIDFSSSFFFNNYEGFWQVDRRYWTNYILHQYGYVSLCIIPITEMHYCETITDMSIRWTQRWAFDEWNPEKCISIVDIVFFSSFTIKWLKRWLVIVRNLVLKIIIETGRPSTGGGGLRGHRQWITSLINWWPAKSPRALSYTMVKAVCICLLCGLAIGRTNPVNIEYNPTIFWGHPTNKVSWDSCIDHRFACKLARQHH